MYKLSLAVGLCFLVGCQPAGQQDITVLKDELNTIKAHESKVDRPTRAEFGALSSRLDQLQAQLDAARLAQGDSKNFAIFDPISDQGYGIVEVDFGKLAVAIDDIAPYADGSRITLRIANPTSITFQGVKAKIVYGASVSKFSADKPSAWNATQKVKEFDLTTPIVPARWNAVVVTLPGSKPEEIGRLVVSLTTNQIATYR
jgi:hypothetical protein